MNDSDESFQVSEKRPSQSSLRYAAQPDVVLSQERDAYYTDSLLGESASELVETLLGSRRAMILAPELKALASCLYFGLTNFAGKQTLGQEYCDIDLTRGNAGTPLSSSSLRFYTLLRVAVPYLQERLREGWHGLRCLGDPRGGGGAAAVLAAARARARARVSLAPPVGIAPSSELNETRRGGVEHGAAAAAALAVAEGTGASGQQGVETATLSSTSPVSDRPRVPYRHRSSSFSSVLEVILRRLVAWARRKRPAISGVIEWVLRLHLAAFYFDGRFVTLAMRAVGARLAYTHRQDEPRASYAILGVFLMMQAAAEAASVGAEASTRWRQAATANATAAQGQARVDAVHGTRDNEGQRDEDASEDGGPALSRVPSVTPERTLADAALFPRSRRRCALCMSPRENAAATPCGHLFCWECIVAWCQTSAECPLCRQPATPQSIVCLYQYA